MCAVSAAFFPAITYSPRSTSSRRVPQIRFRRRISVQHTSFCRFSPGNHPKYARVTGHQSASCRFRHKSCWNYLQPVGSAKPYLRPPTPHVPLLLQYRNPCHAHHNDTPPPPSCPQSAQRSPRPTRMDKTAALMAARFKNVTKHNMKRRNSVHNKNTGKWPNFRNINNSYLCKIVTS